MQRNQRIGQVCLELGQHGMLSHGKHHKLLVSQSIQQSMLLLKTHQQVLLLLLQGLHLVVEYNGIEQGYQFPLSLIHI